MVACMASPKLLKGRSSQAGACYVVTAVTYARRALFVDRRLAELVIDEIRRCDEEERTFSLAWVVMPDHVHWLLQLRSNSLSRCLQAFKSRSARAVNLAAARSTQVWQPGFYDHRLRGDQDLASNARYVVTNPVRRALVSRIEEYPYWHCAWIRTSLDL